MFKTNGDVSIWANSLETSLICILLSASRDVHFSQGHYVISLAFCGELLIFASKWCLKTTDTKNQCFQILKIPDGGHIGFLKMAAKFQHILTIFEQIMICGHFLNLIFLGRIVISVAHSIAN